MDNKLITGIIGVVVVVALLGSALVPVIDGLTEGEKTKNEGAGWIRMDYVTGASYSVDVSFDAQGNVKVDYGVPGSGMTDTQTHAADEDTILFASSEMSIWLQDGVINILGKDIDDNVIFDQITESGPIAFLTKDGSGSEFNIDAGATTGLKASTWAYVPKSTGNFGFFDAGTPVDMKDYPVAAVGGGFAGAYGFNDLQAYGLGLQLQTELDADGKLIGGTWVKTAPEELNTMEFDPSTITIQPLDPSIIDLDPIDLGGGMQLMSVPTPTYTDGDWGYNTTTVGGVTKAIIVSYSGAGGDIVVPATVGGYDVHQFGIDAWNMPVFNNSSLPTSTLTFSDGLVVIGGSACQQCTKLTGQLVIPDSVTTIKSDAFMGCTGFTGQLVIPNSVTITTTIIRNCSGFTSVRLPDGITSIPDQFFENCSGLTGQLVIPDSVTSIGYSSYKSCSGFTGQLVIPDSVTKIRGIAFSGCSGLSGTLIIPSTLTTMSETNVFSNCSFDSLIILSESDFNASVFNNMNSLNEVLDLSDSIDYDTARHGIPAAATVSDSIGDAIGYVSFIEIGSEAELSGGAAALLIAVPVVVIAGLLVAFAGYSIVKRF